MPSFETYLISPLISDPARFRAELETALRALKPASVLLTLPDADERTVINLVKAIAPVVQDAGAAALVSASAQVAVRGGADGVHAGAPAKISALRDELKTDRIVGAGGLTSRHDAMDAGEAGADYVMFGEPGPGTAMISPSALAERAAWWAEIFETPCVVYCASAAMIAPMAFTKAEFVALGPWCLADLAGTTEALARARAGLAAGVNATA